MSIDFWEMLRLKAKPKAEPVPIRDVAAKDFHTESCDQLCGILSLLQLDRNLRKNAVWFAKNEMERKGSKVP